MLSTTGFFSVDALEGDRAVAEREREGWRILRLPLHLTSKDEFFDGVRRTLPLDPPLHSNRSWDALADSLWAGLDGLPDKRIVVVWSDASSMEAHAAEDFAIATDIMRDLPQSFSDAEVTAGATKQVLVLQVI